MLNLSQLLVLTLSAEKYVKVPEEIDRCIKKYEIETKKSRIATRKQKVSPSCYP
ncbi:hypothetical protein HMPREF0813_01554 [Streptococcus anginosus F0211]|uniref:Uncharacterized protein n=1 Tax=Streptococcus anginosus F0211 TaxID=706437 RepID=E6J2R4_STRAP|nr:hypothetical protein [Streptococcus anginosus]EFU21823.1 hypothetical protein HMPREF0813_01554 [Streptococcus anginosus F0211]